jgi:hypothetical protein
MHENALRGDGTRQVVANALVSTRWQRKRVLTPSSACVVADRPAYRVGSVAELPRGGKQPKGARANIQPDAAFEIDQVTSLFRQGRGTNLLSASVARGSGMACRRNFPLAAFQSGIMSGIRICGQ